MVSKHSFARRRGFELIAVAVALAGTLPLGLVAQGAAMTDTWNNTATDYNAPSSYVEGLDPTGNITVFSGAADAGHQPNVTANISVSAVHFGTGSSDTGATGYVLSGEPGAVLTVTSGITSYSQTGTNTVSSDIALGGHVSLSAAAVSNGATNGTLIIAGNISEGATAEAVSLGDAGGHGWTVVLSGDNTFSGGVGFSNNHGFLDINSATAMGTGALSIGTTVTGSIDNTSGSAIILTNNNGISLSTTTGNNGLSFVGSNDLSFGTGAVNLTNSKDANQVISVGGHTLTLDGPITGGSAGLVKNGVGRLVLGGVGTYTGTTSVTNGVLTVNGSLGSGGVSVAENTNSNTATLAGTGGSIAGPVTIAAKSGNKITQISPGDGLTAGSVGHVSFGSSLDIEGAAILDLNKSGSSLTNDEFLFTGGGALTLGESNTLALNFEGDDPSNGDTWTIASGFGSLLGTFGTPTVTGLPVDDTYAVNYLANSITVSVTAPSTVPEPASLALLGLGAAALLKRRRV